MFKIALLELLLYKTLKLMYDDMKIRMKYDQFVNIATIIQNSTTIRFVEKLMRKNSFTIHHFTFKSSLHNF